MDVKLIITNNPQFMKSFLAILSAKRQIPTRVITTHYNWTRSIFRPKFHHMETTSFNNVKKYPEDVIFAINRAYQEDKSDQKVNLSIGAYRDSDGRPYILPVVKTVEIQLSKDLTLDKEYFPIDGHRRFVNNSIDLILGRELLAKNSSTIHGVQTLSGTGALRVCVDFLNSLGTFNHFAIPDLTWPIHKSMLETCKVKNVLTYKYLNSDKLELDFDNMVNDLKSFPDNTVVVLQCCCQNPTGVDPSVEQWNEICSIVKSKNMITIFDAAYIGFATGSIDADCYPIRLFVENNMELFVCVSFAKCFGLYNERIGLTLWSLKDKEASENTLSSIKYIIRNTYSNPPSHGARIVDSILNNPEYKTEWLNTLSCMTSRIVEMRKALFEQLVEIECPGDWSHIINQRGMFSYTGLKVNHVERLAEKFHIYLLKSGRINICGLTVKNIEYVASSIKEVIEFFKN